MDVLGVFVASWRQWFLPIDGIVGAIHRDPQLLPSEPLNCMYTVRPALPCGLHLAPPWPGSSQATLYAPAVAIQHSCAHSAHPGCMCALAASQSPVMGVGGGGVWFNFGAIRVLLHGLLWLLPCWCRTCNHNSPTRMCMAAKIWRRPCRDCCRRTALSECGCKWWLGCLCVRGNNDCFAQRWASI